MNNASNLSLYGLIILTLASGILLSSSIVSAEDVHVSNVNVAVPASCELSGTGTLHSANVNNGTYQEDIGKTTLTVFCNDGGGYALYAVGYTGEEIGGTDSTKLIGITSDLKINTGAYIQGTTTDSVWSMKVSKVTDSSVSYNPANLTIENGFGSYSAVPNAYTKVASFTSTTDLTLGSKLETTYAAYVSGLQRADTYAGKVKYTLVHPGTIAGNTLYIMQDVASWKDSLSTGQEVYAMDARDGKFYSVAKLADGNIWMTQNLDLDIDSNTTYTSADTDLPAGTTWTPGRSTFKAPDTTWFRTYELINSEPGFVQSRDPGELFWNGVFREYSSSYTSVPQETASTGDSHSAIGNYYNRSAAQATNNSSTTVDQSICPAGWALPRIGSGDDSFYQLFLSYGYVDDGGDGDSVSFDSSSVVFHNPMYFVPGGRLYSSGYEVTANMGNYASFGDEFGGAMIGDEGAMTSVCIQFDDWGSSVRCIARPVTSTIINNNFWCD
ncbi:hypothetical protein J6V85_02830 [Candidatus Saccharibacteria bacterium]|nr:hypothetical protein [Candidatus Saccharibacteria bacterium]